MKTCPTSPENPIVQSQTFSKDQEIDCFDLIGIGFGPANLSLSVRLAEENFSFTAHQVLPSNSGVSEQPDDHNLPSHKSLKTCFIESNDSFRWHPGMMIDGARMQISFLKDLVTLRNPCSPFSFLNYLHSHGRLVSFINCAVFSPTRLEFADYLAWVARQVTSCSSPTYGPTEAAISHIQNSISLCYGERVVSVKAVLGTSGDVDFLRVSSIKSDDDSLQHNLCRNLIISVGGRPRIPRCCEALLYHPFRKTCHVIHTSTYLHHIDHILSNIVQHYRQQPISQPTSSRSQSSTSLLSSASSDDSSSDSVPIDPVSNDPRVSENSSKIRIAVVGAGQSAAETLLETYQRLKSTLSLRSGLEDVVEIELIIKQGHLKPSDDSPFVNEVFNPKSTDFFYDLISKEFPTSSKAQGQTDDRKNLRTLLLQESASTNYAVISSETLTALHDIIYNQKVIEGMGAVQSNVRAHFQEPKISIINYTEVISAEPNPSAIGSVSLVLRNVLTGNQSSSRYDAVILGTGYFRQSWKEILFGRPTEYSGSGINLVDLWPNISMESQTRHDFSSDAAIEDNLTDSILSSRSSDEHDHVSCCLSETSQKSLNDVKVARNYRLLLPTTFIAPNQIGASPGANVKKFRPTVWLQGCNESTHGISDSLLSVLSIRAGEVFDGIHKEGWFGKPEDARDKDLHDGTK